MAVGDMTILEHWFENWYVRRSKKCNGLTQEWHNLLPTGQSMALGCASILTNIPKHNNRPEQR